MKLAEYDYTVRADGKRTGATETFWLDSNGDGTPEPHVNQIAWVYDDVGRLTDEVFNNFDNTLDQAEHVVYDLVGNRFSLTKTEGQVNRLKLLKREMYGRAKLDLNQRFLHPMLLVRPGTPWTWHFARGIAVCPQAVPWLVCWPGAAAFAIPSKRHV